ncbi:MAG: serine hydrolase domain-containing protein [Bacteroidota bacterium]
MARYLTVVGKNNRWSVFRPNWSMFWFFDLTANRFNTYFFVLPQVHTSTRGLDPRQVLGARNRDKNVPTGLTTLYIYPMRFHLCYSLILLSLAVFAQPQDFQLAATVEDQGFAPDRLAKLDSFLRHLVDEAIVPQAVTFVARRGEIVHHKGFGYHNLDTQQPISTDALFRIASQTKAIVTIGLLTLYEEGHFLLEDPISKYLPEFSHPRILSEYDTASLEYTSRPAEVPINIRHLLTHTAGIPYSHPLEERPEFQLPYFASLEADQLEEVCRKIAARPLLHEPGEQFTYGLNIEVIGRLIEVLSGQALDVFLQQRIFIPLGMNDTHFYLPPGQENRLVELYSKAAPDAPLELHENETYRTFAYAGAQTYFSGGAGLVGSIEDYAKFLQMLLNGGRFNDHRILSPHTIDFLLRNHSGDNTVWNRQDPYGLGFMRFSAQSRYGDQASTSSFNWGGMYCSEYTADPDNELLLLIYTNVHPVPQYSEIVRKFRIMVYSALLE